jgi:predicted enzyme related to lactoylglutathione lyase
MELLTPDVGAAVDFYCRAIGWSTEVYGGLQEPYPMWTANGAPIGGALRLPAGSGGPAAWLGYLGTNDVDATVTRTVALGGSVCAPARDVPTVGRFAVLADPFGATFAAFRPQSGLQNTLENPAVGDFSWHELATGEIARALAFYGELFGWEPGRRHEMGAAGSYQIFGRGSRSLGGIYERPPGARSSWLPYVRVLEAGAGAERVRRAGGKVLHGPHEVPGGDRIVICADPQGASFALHEVTA